MFPVLVALVPLVFRKQAVRIVAAIVMGGFVLISGMSIGMVYLPAGILMLLAACVEDSASGGIFGEGAGAAVIQRARCDKARRITCCSLPLTCRVHSLSPGEAALVTRGDSGYGPHRRVCIREPSDCCKGTNLRDYLRS